MKTILILLCLLIAASVGAGTLPQPLRNIQVNDPLSSDVYWNFGNIEYHRNRLYNGEANLDIANLTLTGTLTADGTTIEVKSDISFEGDVYTVGWTDYSATSTIVGWSSYITKKIYYKKIGKLCFINFAIRGTSDSTAASFTLPYTSSNDEAGTGFMAAVQIKDNGTDLTTPGRVRVQPNEDVLYGYKDMVSGAWTNSGEKMIRGQFWYEAQ